MRRSLRVDSPLYPPRARRRRRAITAPRTLALVAGIAAALAILVGLAFAGSRSELAAGTQVAGVDVGGLTRREAVAKLDHLFEQRSSQPVAFVAAGETYRFAANQLAVQPDWTAAVAAASRAGDGFGPLRGFRRLRARVFGAQVLPRLTVSNAALEYALDKIADDVDVAPKSAELVRRGLRIEVVPARDRRASRPRCRRRGHRALARTARADTRRDAASRDRDAPEGDGGDARGARRERAARDLAPDRREGGG